METLDIFKLKRGKEVEYEIIADRKIVFNSPYRCYLLEDGKILSICPSQIQSYVLNLPFKVKDIVYCEGGIYILSECNKLYIYTENTMRLQLFIDNIIDNKIGVIERAVKSAIHNNIIYMYYIQTSDGWIMFDSRYTKLVLSQPIENLISVDFDDNYIILLYSNYDIKLINLINNSTSYVTNVSSLLSESEIDRISIRIRDNIIKLVISIKDNIPVRHDIFNILTNKLICK